jgi:uncharacterized protein
MNGRPWALVSFLACSMVALAPRARAAGFDCAKAATPTEKLICGDAQLSQLDGQLVQAYRRALEGAADPDKLREEQRTWLRTERKACTDVACLKKVYAQRLTALAAVPGPEKPLGPGAVESAPAGGGSGTGFGLAPLLDKAKGDAAVAAYLQRSKHGALAIASGSFTRADADEVLLVVPTGVQLCCDASLNALVIMQKAATGYRIVRRMGEGEEFKVRARITGPGRPDRVFICSSGGRQGFYPMTCGFLGQGSFAWSTRHETDPSTDTDVQMGFIIQCGQAGNIAPGKLRVDGDHVALDVVVEEYVLAGDDCETETKKSSKTLVLTYELGVKAVRLLTPIPPHIKKLAKTFELDPE